MSMKRPRHNMGRVEWIGAESVGVPGQRTFRLIAKSRSLSAELWLEKEQLQALAEAIARMMLEIDTERGFDIPPREIDTTNSRPADFPDHTDVTMQIGALSLSYDTQREVIAIEATSREEEDEEAAPTFRCLATREQIQLLQVNALDVISMGRPKCPLCGAPLPAAGTPHFCPPTNGHQKIAIEEE